MGLGSMDVVRESGEGEFGGRFEEMEQTLFGI
jgi:hypothetical protein